MAAVSLGLKFTAVLSSRRDFPSDDRLAAAPDRNSILQLTRSWLENHPGIGRINGCGGVIGSTGSRTRARGKTRTGDPTAIITDSGAMPFISDQSAPHISPQSISMAKFATG